MARIAPIEDVVDINLGGQKNIQVSKSTLCRIPGSYLALKFSGRHE